MVFDDTFITVQDLVPIYSTIFEQDLVPISSRR